MATKDIFERAAWGKVRFQYKGSLSSEQLCELSVTELDSIFKKLNSEAKSQEEESLLETKTAANTVLKLKLDIVKHIVKVKLEEKEARATRAEKSEKKRQLLALLGDKQNEALKNLSAEEIQAQIDAL